VSVNEAVELAKRYSGEEAGSFINGILSKISSIDPNISDSDTEAQKNGG
jgi:N utilization substance protein B